MNNNEIEALKQHKRYLEVLKATTDNMKEKHNIKTQIQIIDDLLFYDNHTKGVK